ncbi:MAG: hypothetical protein IJT44_09760 [Clostridia bacterium]|nr:hypothetical protein [Clostridia bacterium]
MPLQSVQVIVPVQTLAALIQACVAVENIIEYADVTPDILEELESILPELQRFAETQ